MERIRLAAAVCAAGLALAAGAAGPRFAGPPAPTLPPRSGGIGAPAPKPAAPKIAPKTIRSTVKPAAPKPPPPPAPPPPPPGVGRHGPVVGAPRHGPVVGAPRHGPVVRTGPIFGRADSPWVSEVRYRPDGSLAGFHVVSPAVVENPFAIFPQGRAAMVAPAPQPPPRTVVVETREAVALPSAAVCEAREQEALDAKLADPSVVRPTIACAEEPFRRDALGLVRSQYRASPQGLVPASVIEVAPSGVVRRKHRMEVDAWPQPTEAQILAAFRAGGRFVVVRRRDVAVPCGMCEGSGAVVRERVANPATGVVRAVTGACPRCGGKGRRNRPIDAIYTIVNAASRGVDE